MSEYGVGANINGEMVEVVKPRIDERVKRLENRFLDVVNVKDFGAVGDGIADDTVSIQAAIDSVCSLSGTARPSVYLPSGSYKITSPLIVPTNTQDFSIFSDAPYSAEIIVDTHIGIQLCDDDFFVIGADTKEAIVHDFSIENIDFICAINRRDQDCIAIKHGFYRSVIRGCRFTNFSVSIDGYRAKMSMSDCKFYCGQRTAGTAIAFVRLRGVYNSNVVNATGGNDFITDCDFSGYSVGIVGFLVHTVDGLYISKCHFSGCTESMEFTFLDDANNGNAQRAITEVKVDNCYFDDPLDKYGVSHNVKFSGSLYESCLFQNIHFYNCLFRGALEAEYGVLIAIRNDNGVDYAIKNVSISDSAFRQHTMYGVQVNGPQNGYAKVNNIQITNCSFERENTSGTANYNSSVVYAKSLMFIGNIVYGPVNQTAHCVAFYGEDSSSSAIITGNDFTNADYSGTPIVTSGTYKQVDTTSNLYKDGNLGEIKNCTLTLASGATTKPTVQAKYTKKGCMVFVQAKLAFGQIDVNGTDIVISGLPFRNSSEQVDVFASSIARSNFNSSAVQFWTMANNSNELRLMEILPNAGSATAVKTQSSGTFSPSFGNISIAYMTAD